MVCLSTADRRHVDRRDRVCSSAARILFAFTQFYNQCERPLKHHRLLCDGDRRNARPNLDRKLGRLLGLEPTFGPRLSNTAKR